MKNHSKILCVVLALIIALTAAACSLSKQYAYQKDDIELPIGSYILYLQQAYSQAQGYAQESELYDAEKGTYDGKKSFLKMEITDEDGNTAVAEDWIINKAKEMTTSAVAQMYKFNELGCTLDEAALSETETQIKTYWDQGYSDQYEPYGIGEESLVALTKANTMGQEAFKAQYSADGPTPVTDDDLAKYFTENYTSYKYFSADLYTTETQPAEDGSSEDTTVDVPLSEDKIADYQKDFDSYASTLSSGGSFDDVLKKYMDKYEIEEDPHTENVTILDDESTDEVMSAIRDLKDGQAMTITVGDTDESKQLYLIYREPIENQVDAYTKTATGDEADTETETTQSNRDSVLSSMKSEEFEQLIKDYAAELNITLSSDCNKYKPSMFEQTK